MADLETNIVLKLKDLASDGIAKVRRSFANISEDANVAKKNADEFRSKLEGVGAVGTTVSIIAGGISLSLGALGKAALTAAGEVEQNRIAFTTMLGSAEKAKNLMAQISDLAMKSPFEYKDLTEYTQRLLAMGVEQENVIDTMKMLGDIASGVGMEKLPQLILALGQVRTAGHLTGMELRQFTEAGVPLMETLALSTGKTIAQMKDLQEKGQISYDMVRKALEKLTSEGGKFHDLMEKQNKSLSGQISNVKDAFFRLASTIGEKLIPIVQPLVEGFSKLVMWFSSLSPATQTFIAITGLGVFVIASLATAFGGVLAILPLIASGMATLGVTIGGLVSASGIGLAIVVIGALTTAFIANREEFLKWGAGIASVLIGALDSVLKSLSGISNAFSNFLKSLPLGDKLSAPFDYVSTSIDNTVKKLDAYKKSLKEFSIDQPKTKQGKTSGISPVDKHPEQGIDKSILDRASDEAIKAHERYILERKRLNQYSAEEELALLEKLLQSNVLTSDGKIKVLRDEVELKKKIQEDAFKNSVEQYEKDIKEQEISGYVSVSQKRERLQEIVNSQTLTEEQSREIKRKFDDLDIQDKKNQKEASEFLYSEEQRSLIETENKKKELKSKQISEEKQQAKAILDIAREEAKNRNSVEGAIYETAKSYGNKYIDDIKKQIIAKVDLWASEQTAQGYGRLAASAGLDPTGYAMIASAVAGSIAIRQVADSIKLADGGIVLPKQGGVQATIGEAGSAEAVIPLDSPTAKEMMGGTDSSTKVIILDADGMTTLAKGVYKKQKELKRLGLISEGI